MDNSVVCHEGGCPGVRGGDHGDNIAFLEADVDSIVCLQTAFELCSSFQGMQQPQTR